MSDTEPKPGPNALHEDICAGHSRKRPAQHDVDKLADILWWIQGAIDNAPTNCPFNSYHVEALRKHREYVMYDEKGEYANAGH